MVKYFNLIERGLIMDYKKCEEFLQIYMNKAEEIINGSNIIKRVDDIRELGLKIESLLSIVYSDDKEKIKDYHENYLTKLNDFFSAKEGDILIPYSPEQCLFEVVGYFKRVLGSVKDYIELKMSSDKDLALLEKIEKEVKFEKAEAERRKAVQEAKEAGATIEIIQALRDELKNKSQTGKNINEIKAELREIKELLKQIQDTIVAFS